MTRSTATSTRRRVLALGGGIVTHAWALKGCCDTLPSETEEAARVDGAKPWQAFWRVLLPMALPILVVFLLAQRWMIAGLAAGGVKG
jgi:ABC-type maltose transport system permease subunit